MKLSGWGRFPVHETETISPSDISSLRKSIEAGKAIARGNGRAYGDSAVGSENTIHMKHFNRMIAFNNDTGTLTAEAGVLLEDVIKVFLPRGWFPFVTPGTKFVTLGGMAAADVHGKNHHKEGSFSNFVDWIELIDKDGKIIRCSQEENTEFFRWTLGGMGLTGIIIRLAMRLRRVETAWINQKTISTTNLDATIDLFDEHDTSTYSVAWIDCQSKGKKLGRSLLILGEHARISDLSPVAKDNSLGINIKKSKTIPFDMPNWLLNQYSISAFNSLYYWNGRRKVSGQELVDWDTYFYPLDAILGWNKIYGRKGFIQFQCVIPPDQSRNGLRSLLEAIVDSGQGSFLAVLKKLGDQASPFSFPRSGYTLALDFPINAKTLDLLEKLDEITIAYGGRFYLAKDSRMSENTLKQTDPRAADFAIMRAENKFNDAFQSKQSERLNI